MAESEFRQVLSAKANRIEPYLEAIAFFEKQNKLPDMEAAIAGGRDAQSEHDPRVAFFQAVAMGSFGLGTVAR